MAQAQSTVPIDNQMDDTWGNFLKHKVNSFIKWDLVRFFHDNPHTADTVDNIAGYIGRDTRTVQAELNELVDTSILDVTMVSGIMIYRYSSDPESRNLIGAFVNACYDRDFRVRAIQLVIHGMSLLPGHNR